MAIKWFQHLSDSHANGKMRQILRKHGLEGYAFCWICRELVAREGENYIIRHKKDWKITLEEVTLLSPERIDELLLYQAEIGAIDPKSLEKGNLYIPKLRSYSDDYTKRQRREAGYSSHKVPLHNITLDNITREEKTIDKTTLSTVVNFFVSTKNYVKSDLSNNDWTRIQKGAKDLLLRTNGDTSVAIDAIRWMAEKDYEWTIETVVKKFPDFQKTIKSDAVKKVEALLEQSRAR